jgi:hypothetical protein
VDGFRSNYGNSGHLVRGARVSIDYEIDWYGPAVVATINQAMHARGKKVADYLKKKIVSNISVSITGTSGRSKPGEFPRAETKKLMGSIFSDVVIAGIGIYDVSVGSTAEYAAPLELSMDRSFLKRTLMEETQEILRIFATPIMPLE